MASIYTVIVNYRTAELTLDCLSALAPEVQNLPGYHVTVVDGGSADGSVERLTKAVRSEGWGGWCEVLPLEENRGFAAGNNAAIRSSLAGAQPPAYIWLLNPDTVVRPGAVRELVNFLERNLSIGIVGSRLEDANGTPQRSAFRFPTVAGEFEGGARFGPISRLFPSKVVAPPVQDNSHPTDWVCGASMMIRREVFESIGLLDEGYFLYYEETDFCLRARRAGWLCWYVPASHVIHLVSKSTGINDPNQRIPMYWLSSRYRYFRANHGLVYTWLANLAGLVGHVAWWLRVKMTGKPAQVPSHFLRDFFRYNFLPVSLMQ